MLRIFLLLFLGVVNSGTFDIGTPFDRSKCSLLPPLVAEIRSYQPVANAIFEETTQKSFRRKTYKDLRYLVDSFGPRLTGKGVELYAFEAETSWIGQCAF